MRAPDRFVRTSGRRALGCASVAGEVLDLAERHGSLRELQVAVLIPLELELAKRTEVNNWSPRPWVTVVTTVLHDPRRQRERRARTQSKRTGGE